MYLGKDYIMSEKDTTISNRTPTRTVRVDDAVWSKAKVKADREGKNISEAVRLLLQGYSEGKIKLPKVTLTY